jgi:hypothetical protein
VAGKCAATRRPGIQCESPAPFAGRIIWVLEWSSDTIPENFIPDRFQSKLDRLKPLLGPIYQLITRSRSVIRVDPGMSMAIPMSPPHTIYVWLFTGYGVKLAATWSSPTVLIPGMWKFYDVPETPQTAGGRTPSQPAPNVTESKVHTSQEPNRGRQARESPSPSHVSKHQLPQDRLGPGNSAIQTHPEHGYPNPMYLNSSAFHYDQCSVASDPERGPGRLLTTRVGGSWLQNYQHGTSEGRVGGEWQTLSPGSGMSG